MIIELRRRQWEQRTFGENYQGLYFTFIAIKCNKCSLQNVLNSTVLH